MQIHEAAEIIEVLGQAKANELLAAGWKLLAVTTATGNDDNRNLYVHYVLGKKQVTPAPMGSLVSGAPMKG
ncbi:hypothetical protein [Pseudomonas sp. FP1740]|uniref:hypothetical protein n=1 Tax=Pseudomonas sp. FP1740 TaxID=2954078 RepID=UPI0027327E1A|nr:hypothetical protein [Pseudomonas sp. FP1740]WLG46741.1 hypothetical protein PSH69_09035 [Pseudomonas sp. FP1740]